MSRRAAARIVQNGYVVRDLDMACERLRAMLGVGPFVGGTEVTLEDHHYRGAPTAPIRLRGVFVQSGDLNIELIQILSPGPSAFHDMIDTGRDGLHHVALFCEDYEAEKAHWVAAGHAIASEFTTGFGAKICYVDARDTLGHFIELYPEHPIIRAMYARTVEAARDWDGEQLMVPW
ncbi:VOC family protein [Sphingobium sp. CR2-8]|uniref:VOC family protein n=1 Tax=Sphingobium sp. CR2-8 TaxID=1306534 RepID=UPI002DB83A8B|nr:VOC family protein [Sphingobium sp. CR2-8]MEC3910999.1 VOC family protein [Sphingobium sp. CR2-8]